MALISTRLHGAIDYLVAGSFVALARSGRLPPPVGRVLDSAAAYHAGYAMLTEYEGGIRPVIGMRTHLLLDGIGALALCAAGLGMRRQPGGARALLLAAGLAEAAVIALSRDRPGEAHGHAEGPSYPPLDTPKPVADGVWIVDSVLPGLLGHVIGVRMTVLRLENGDLVLHSPTRITAGLRAALERLGRIRHLVAPNLAHLSFIADWKAAYPDATLWAAPGVASRRTVKRGQVRVDHELSATPSTWLGDIDVVLLPGGGGFTEAALFHHPTRTAVLTDSVLNLEPRKVPRLLRPLLRLFGSVAPDGMSPPYLRALMRIRARPLRAAAETLLAMGPERVVFAHGRWFERDGAAALRRSWRWILR